MTFKDRFREEIEYKGILIKEISAEIGISNNTFLSYINSRNVMPNVETAVKIAKVLNVSVEYLVTGEDSSISQKSPDLLNIIRTIQNLDSIDLNSINQLVVAMQKRY